MIGQNYCLDQDPSGNNRKHIAVQTAPLVARKKKNEEEEEARKGQSFTPHLQEHILA